MSDQKAILLVTAKVNKEKMEDLKSYLEKVGPLTGKYGGQGVARCGKVQNCRRNCR